jgi:hypothetical protein
MRDATFRRIVQAVLERVVVHLMPHIETLEAAAAGARRLVEIFTPQIERLARLEADMRRKGTTLDEAVGELASTLAAFDHVWGRLEAEGLAGPRKEAGHGR